MPSMPALHVRDVPESVLAALRERAARHGRSVQQEVRELLAVAATREPPPEPVEAIRLKTVRTGGSSTWRREAIYDEPDR